MNESLLKEDTALESLLAEVTDEFLERLKRGEEANVDDYVARYPQLADVLRQMLPALQLMRTPRSDATPASGPEVEDLGDFHLLREVGHGGMGIVYEAEQRSLGRRVAVKVLPFAGALDPRQLQRFKNEAQAAAQLHHTNIVPVYFVGCERGVHFYAMQYIEGQTLAAVIRELRRHGGFDQADEKSRPETPLEVAEELVSERLTPEKRSCAGPPTTAYTPPPAAPMLPSAETTPQVAAGLSTERSIKSVAYVRRVAQLGVQAAEGLEHAHQMGVVHRDIKPANLLLDVRGDVWITDFGLAHCQSQAGLTMTGDLLGTLRYMSPEQALAKRVIVDHRTDIYSLGATLYELLTLEPAYRGNDRQELLRQIAFEEPRPPRRLNKAIPAELETIVLKAMEKNPADRYATAQELADDLRHFLEDKPIRARRPTLVQRARRWSRRHRAVVWAAALVLLVVAVFAGGTGLWWVQRRAGAEGEARAALREATELQKEEKWIEALSAAKRAQGVLAGFWADRTLRQQVDELAKDLEMAHRLEEARLQMTAVKDGYFDSEAANEAYSEAFDRYGLDVDRLDPDEAAERIRSCSIRLQLAAALDDWAHLRSRLNVGGWTQLLAVSRAADPDPWRNRLRDAVERKDPRALEELVASAGSEELPPTTAVLLVRLTGGTAASERAVGVLRRGQQRHPDNFWINHELAFI